jgi:hypothetical protein
MSRDFPEVLIHALPPRTRDDARAARWTGGVTIPRAVRAKLTVLANRVLEGACARAGIAFVGDWEGLVGADGYLRPELDLDGVHLHQRAAAQSLAQIRAVLEPQV